MIPDKGENMAVRLDRGIPGQISQFPEAHETAESVGFEKTAPARGQYFAYILVSQIVQNLGSLVKNSRDYPGEGPLLGSLA